jgi:hypothetical protein
MWLAAAKYRLEVTGPNEMDLNGSLLTTNNHSKATKIQATKPQKNKIKCKL